MAHINIAYDSMVDIVWYSRTWVPYTMNRHQNPTYLILSAVDSRNHAL